MKFNSPVEAQNDRILLVKCFLRIIETRQYVFSEFITSAEHFILFKLSSSFIDLDRVFCVVLVFSVFLAEKRNFLMLRV